MRYLKADTSVKVVIGPFVDVGDGFTPETSITLGAADEAELVKHDNATAVDISGNTWAALTNVDGYYHLTLTAGNLDTEGQLSVVVQDDSVCLPVVNHFHVVNANVYDSLFAASGTDTLDVQVAGMDANTVTSSVIATNAITASALATNTITADKIAADAIGASELATDAVDEIADGVWDEALSGHNTGGTAGKALRNAGGIILDTGTADAGAATTIDLETGVANTNDDFYNHTVIIITGGTGAGQERLITDYVGSTQQATVTPAWISGLEPDATSQYEIIPGTVHAETQGGGYAGGAVWIGPSGSTGTQLYVDGTVDNPIDDGQMANAKTVADALNLRLFRIEPTSSITLGATFNGYSFEGVEYTLNLGSQDVSNTYISGASIAASTATGTGAIFNNCIFDNAVTLPPCTIRNSYLGDTTITAGSAGNYFINHCVSRAAGNGVAPNFDFGAALNASNLNIRDWSGGIELENMGTGTGTYNASIEGQGNVIINANCSATSNLAIRGMFTLTDNAGGAVTVSDDARIDVAQINAEADQALTDYDAATGTELAAVDTKIDTIDTVVDRIEVDTQDLQTQVGTAGAGLTDLGGMSTAMKAEVNAEADTALTDYDAATGAELAAVDTKIDTIDTNVDTLLTRITATLFSGITSLAEWLGQLAGKQAADATAQTEIRASGAGSGTYDATTDSLEAVRDNQGGGGGDATAANQTTIISHLTDIKGGTFSGSTDSLEAIRDRGDAAWVTGGSGSLRLAKATATYNSASKELRVIGWLELAGEIQDATAATLSLKNDSGTELIADGSFTKIENADNTWLWTLADGSSINAVKNYVAEFTFTVGGTGYTRSVGFAGQGA